MVEALDKAHYQSLDPAPGDPLVLSWTEKNASTGRPKIQVDPGTLATAVGLRSMVKLGIVYNCSARTLRRRLLEYGLAEPGTPVFSRIVAEDSSITVEHSPAEAAMSDITDEQLDKVVGAILEDFPDFGRSMIAGSLRAHGWRVSPKRAKASFLRMHGTPGVFGARRILRKKYKVPGANSLWHHDGQHGKCYNYNT